VHGTTHGRIEQRAGQSAMHHADGVVVVFVRGDAEDSAASCTSISSKPSSRAMGGAGRSPRAMACRNSRPLIPGACAATTRGSSHATVRDRVVLV
jgi:hypothetical protein